MSAWTADRAWVRTVDRIEGRPVGGTVTVKVLARTPQQLVLDVTMTAGSRSSPHSHPCDSAGVVIDGEVRAWVAGAESLLRPGDGYHHPEGVEHHVEAVTDARMIEIKSPPIPPW